MRKRLEKTWLVVKILFLRLRFIFLFVAIGLIVGHWSWIVNVADRFLRPAAEETPEVTEGEHEGYCPMHPWIVLNDPRAPCPICGMKLAQRKRGAQEELSAGVLARLRLSDSRIQQAGVATEEVAYRTLVREVRTVGFITYDERRLRDLSARIAGRVDKLYVDFTGVRVRAGDPLYEIYSPELVTTEEAYLLDLQSLAALESEPGEGSGGTAARDRARRLVEASRERLRLWGIGEAEIAKLERDRKAQDHLVITAPYSGVVIEKNIHAGHYVAVGEDPYTVADDSVVWLEAEVFEADIGLVREGQVLEVTAEAYPGEKFAGAIVFIAPQLRTETRTITVRADVENKESKLKPGMYVTAVLRVPLGKREELSADAPPEAAPAPADPAKVYVCEMHREEAFPAPGTCERCGGMVLEERALPPGAKLVYVCPEHPDSRSEKPGTCSVAGCGQRLEYKVEAAASEPADEWMCPLHPQHTAAEGRPCPECGAAMKRYRHERLLAVPLSAVIDTGSRKIVFIDRGGGVFEAVEVVVGPRAGEYYQVLRGLAAGDRIVTAGAFLLDAETRLHPAAGTAYLGASGHEGHGGRP